MNSESGSPVASDGQKRWRIAVQNTQYPDLGKWRWLEKGTWPNPKAPCEFKTLKEAQSNGYHYPGYIRLEIEGPPFVLPDALATPDGERHDEQCPMWGGASKHSGRYCTCGAGEVESVLAAYESVLADWRNPLPSIEVAARVCRQCLRLLKENERLITNLELTRKAFASQIAEVAVENKRLRAELGIRRRP